MKKLFPWLLAALMVAVVSCSDDSTTTDRTETYTERAWTTEVAAATVSGAWTAAGSPYYVPQTVTVPAGQTLTIQPGVDVYFGPTASLIVDGNLQAVGQLGNPVRFMGVANAEDYGLWQSIVFHEGSDDSRMAFCVVACGSKFNNTDPEKIAAIVIVDSSPTIEHCFVWLSQYNGISLQRDSAPRLRSNIVYENDGSGIVIDTSHVGARLVAPVVIDWLGDSLIAHNNVSNNSSLQLRFPPSFADNQWSGADSLLGQFGNDVLYVDENGDDFYRRNENNDKVDRYGNSIEDAMFDELSLDFQSFNSCSPCIESAFDRDGAQRADVGPIVYAESPGELRKRLKTTSLGNQVYTVTCDAFSVDPVTISGSEIQFNGYFGLHLSGGVTATDATFQSTADRREASSWKSLVVDDNVAGTARFEGCTFAYGAESSYSGSNYVAGGGLLELRNGAVVEVVDCDFHDAGGHGVSVDGAGSLAHVKDSRFDNIGLSAVFFYNGARGKVEGSRIEDCGSYGIFLLETDYHSQIEGNLIAGGGLYGIKLQEAPDVDILQNTIVGNAYGGIRLEEQCDPTIRYNLIADNDFAGSEVATGIVGNQLGTDLDTNNPRVNVNWFSGNGGDDLDAMPSNWTIGACNSFESVQLGSDYGFAQSLPDCDNGDVAVPIGWSQSTATDPGPMLASLQNPTAFEDESVVIWLGAVSYDGDDAFVYTAEIEGENVALSLEGNRLELTPAPDWNGTVPLTVTVSNASGSDSETAPFTVIAVNDAPVIEQVEDATIAMDGEFEASLTVYDIEDDDYDLSAEAAIAEGENDAPDVVLSGTTLTVTPAAGWTGVLTVWVTAEEDQAAVENPRTTRMTFTLTVE